MSEASSRRATRSELTSVERKGLIADPNCEFLMQSAGERESTDPLNRMKRRNVAEQKTE